MSFRHALARAALLFTCGCATAPKPAPAHAPSSVPAANAEARPAGPAASTAGAERMAADTEATSALGTATLTVPAGWSLARGTGALRIASPDGAAEVAVIELEGGDPDAATGAAWQQFRPGLQPVLHDKFDVPGRIGWDSGRGYEYEVSPNEKRLLSAFVWRTGARSVVLLIDAALATVDRQRAAIGLLAGSLQPAGYERESFAGRSAHVLDAARLQQLDALIELGRSELGIPGVALAIVQNGVVVHRRGYGVREQGKPAKVDADSLFLIGSTTKALTTLLLAQLVDDGKLRWDMPVVEAFPEFKLGKPETTQATQIKHLVCACTGLPRKDFAWLFEFADTTPARFLGELAAIEPTSGFGEVFQYNNQLAGAAGYVAAHVLDPKQELGRSYDRAMSKRVFAPLGMRATTFDFARALRGNHASGHSWNLDGQVVVAQLEINRSVIPLRPAGGAWSSVNDMIRYVQLELARGIVPGSARRIVSEANLLERRKPQVVAGEHETYGMGLSVDRRYDVPIVQHGGSLSGFKARMLWLPDHGVGAVLLANGEGGRALGHAFSRALLEQLFDAKPEASEDLQTDARMIKQAIAAERAKLTIPPDPAIVAQLAARYEHPQLGALELRTAGGEVTLDAGEWKSATATRENPDGTRSLVLIDPVIAGLPLVIGTSAGGKRQLVLREMQHEYAFVEAAAAGEPGGAQ